MANPKFHKVSMKILILFAAAVAAYFGFRLSREICSYASLSEQAPAKILRWEVEEAGSRYAVKGTYEYKNLVGTTQLQRTFFNEAVALDFIKSTSSWTAHYDPTHPEHSALERVFPKGYVIRFVLACAVFIYFLLFKRKFVIHV